MCVPPPSVSCPGHCRAWYLASRSGSRCRAPSTLDGGGRNRESYPRSAWIMAGLRFAAPRLPRIGGIPSTRGNSCVMSLRLASVRITFSRMPCASVRRWCLLPALRRSVGFGPVPPPCTARIEEEAAASHVLEALRTRRVYDYTAKMVEERAQADFLRCCVLCQEYGCYFRRADAPSKKARGGRYAHGNSCSQIGKPRRKWSKSLAGVVELLHVSCVVLAPHAH